MGCLERKNDASGYCFLVGEHVTIVIYDGTRRGRSKEKKRKTPVSGVDLMDLISKNGE